VIVFVRDIIMSAFRKLSGSPVKFTNSHPTKNRISDIW